MVRSKRSQLLVDATVEARRVASSLGQEVRRSRRRRGLTQAALGERVGLSQARISQIEGGGGGSTPLAIWILLGFALERPVAVALARPLASDATLADAGHLKIQEFLLGLPFAARNIRHFELPTRPTDPIGSIDVCVRDDLHGRIVVVEAWNRIGDLGGAIRATHRKLAEAEGLASVAGGETGRPFRVHGCWVLRATAANRQLVTRYPAVIRTALPGSSVGRLEALVAGARPPANPGVVWFDPSRRMLVPTRLARSR